MNALSNKCTKHFVLEFVLFTFDNQIMVFYILKFINKVFITLTVDFI